MSENLRTSKLSLASVGHLGVLLAAAASLVLTWQQTRWSMPDGYFRFLANYLVWAGHWRLWLLVSLVFLCFLGWSRLVSLADRDRWPAGLRKTARRTAGLILLPLASGFIFLLAGPDGDLLLQLVILAGCLTAAGLLALINWRKIKLNYDLLAGALTGLFWVVYSAVSILKHLSFNSFNDLAIFLNILWNSVNGRFFYSDILGYSFWGEHLSVMLVPFIPIYHLWPSPTPLFIFQAAGVALGGWALYLLGRLKELPGYLNLALLLAYFLYLPLFGVIHHDFHPAAFILPFTLWAFYWLERGRDGWFLFFIILSFLCKEVALLNGMFIGLYLLLARRKRALGLGLIIGCFLAFELYVSVMAPYFHGQHYRFFGARYGALGDDRLEIVQNLIEAPVQSLKYIFPGIKLEYLAGVFYPVLFLPLFSGWAAVMLILPLASIVLASFGKVYGNFFTAYGAPSIPFIFYCTILALSDQSSRRRGKFLAFFLIFYGLAAMYQWGEMPLVSRKIFKDRYRLTAEIRQFWQLSKMIPAEASVGCSESLANQLAPRRQLFYIAYKGLPETDYLVFDLFWMKNRQPYLAREENTLRYSLASGKYGVIYRDSRFIILKKGAAISDNQACLDSL